MRKIGSVEGLFGGFGEEIFQRHSLSGFRLVLERNKANTYLINSSFPFSLRGPLPGRDIVYFY